MSCEAMIHTMRKAYLRRIPVLPKLLQKIIRIVYACDVKATCEIDKSVEFFHGGLGVVFHENAVVKENVKIFQHVTLGGNGKPCKKGTNHPVIEEGCTIYAGACVLGPITVGSNSIVGANAVVLRDVPACSIAVGVPAVVKPRRKE